RMVGVRGGRQVAANPRLDRSFLIARDHEFIRLELAAFELACVEVEHARRLELEVGVAREDPAAVGPGLDRVLVKPGPDGHIGDGGGQAGVDRVRVDVGDVQAGKRESEPGRQLTSDRFDDDDQLWGGKSGSGPRGSAPQVRPSVARRSAYATWRRSGKAD